MKNLVKKFLKLLLLCVALNSVAFKDAHSGRYSDLLPVAQSVGRTLAKTKVGRWLSGLFNRSKIVLPKGCHASGDTLTLATPDGCVQCPQEIATYSDMIQARLERWSQHPRIVINHPIDIENLKRILEIEVKFYHLEQQGVEEDEIVSFLCCKLSFNSGKTEELIDVADYLQFRNVLKIFARKFLRKSGLKIETPEDEQAILQGFVPGFAQEIVDEYAANREYYNRPRWQDYIWEEICRTMTLYHQYQRYLDTSTNDELIY